MNQITAQCFDINLSKVVTQYLDMGVNTGRGASKSETYRHVLQDCINDQCTKNEEIFKVLCYIQFLKNTKYVRIVLKHF